MSTIFLFSCLFDAFAILYIINERIQRYEQTLSSRMNCVFIVCQCNKRSSSTNSWKWKILSTLHQVLSLINIKHFSWVFRFYFISYFFHNFFIYYIFFLLLLGSVSVRLLKYCAWFFEFFFFFSLLLLLRLVVIILRNKRQREGRVFDSL